jgi:DNA-binding transcriptional regulator YdaS (Cro superfamily)
MNNVSDNVIMTNPEIMSIFREMETAIIKLMQELGIISPEASQYMQTQSQIPSNQAPQFPNGLPPGVNPMELLQMQQYEQFQKLMQQQQPK